MCLESATQIDIGDYLSVDGDKGFTLEKLTRVIEGSARSQNLRFFNVMKFYAEATPIAERSANRFRTMMKINYYLIDALTSEVFGDVANEWFS